MRLIVSIVNIIRILKVIARKKKPQSMVMVLVVILKGVSLHFCIR